MLYKTRISINVLNPKNVQVLYKIHNAYHICSWKTALALILIHALNNNL